jgi:acyl-CoA synthetase (AMP-forming)/AMP-acid ligase II/thioesterase domain-containing protein/acyl carrier protein
MLPTVTALLAERARTSPDAPAIGEPGSRALSFLELSRSVDDGAAVLVDLGFGRGDRIAVALDGGAAAAQALLATLSVGTAVPLRPDLPRREASGLLELLNVRAVLVRRGDEGPLVSVARGLGLAIVEAAAGGVGLELIGAAIERRSAVRAAEPQDLALVLPTSGTTARPKRVPLSHASLAHAARAAASVLALSPSDRGLCLGPLFHVAGILNGVLWPLSGGGLTLLPRRFDASLVPEWLESEGVTWCGGSPAAHRAVLEGMDRDLPRLLRFVRSAAAPLDKTLRDALEGRLGTVVEGYAMTEAPLIATNAPPPGRRKGDTVGPACGCEIRVVDETGCPLAPGGEGEIQVRGAVVMSGYESPDPGEPPAFADGWFRTRDLGRLDDDGFLTLLGRLKELVNRGGTKVSPQEVDDALLSHPSVARAAAFALPHPRLGEDLAAAVVLREGEEASPGELRAFVAERLTASKVPGRIVVVDRIPTGSSGKALRKELAPLVGAARRAPPNGLPMPPEQAWMCALWADVLGLEHVHPDEDFFDLGGDSLRAAAILARLDSEKGVRLPLTVFFEAPTVLGLVAAALGGRLRSGVVVALRRRGARPPLFWVHGVGGNALNLAKLASRLNAEQPFVAFQSRGLEGRGTPLDSIEEMAALYLCETRRQRPHGPYLLGGFCMGCAVAYEMALRLEAEGEEVALLALVEPPPLPLGHRRSPAHPLRVAAQAALGRLRRWGPAPPIDDRESPVVHANRRALRRYRPRAYDGKVTTFLALDGPPGAAEDAEDALRNLVRGPLEVHRIVGSHLDLMLEPCVGHVAEELEACLDVALGATALAQA